MRARIIILSLVAVVLLLITALIQNLPMVYADKLENHSLINNISEQVVSLRINKDLLQQVLQQIQTQIALTAGQEKATNAIKQINSVIELKPNGPLSQSLLFLAKQQASGNTDAVNQAAMQVAGLVSGGSDNIVLALGQTVASLKSSPSSAQRPAVTTAPTSSSNAAQQQLQHPTQQIQQQTLIPPYNTISNNNTANIEVSNSNPHSSIKVTSVDQQIQPFSPVPISTSSPNAAQQQLQQQQIQQIINQSSYVPSNTNILSTSNSNSHSSIKIASTVQPFSPVPISTSSPITSTPQNDRSQVHNYSSNDHQSIPNLVVNAGSPVTLDGSPSYDPDGNQMTFAWTQTAGPSVMISDANTSKAKFTAPNLDTGKRMLFKLTVTDENGLSDSGLVQITVIPSTSTSPSLGSSMN
jgi:hypothetical protein